MVCESKFCIAISWNFSVFLFATRIVALTELFCRLWAFPESKPWGFFSTFYNWSQNNQLIFLHCLLQIIKSNRSSISSITFWSLYSYYGPPYNNRESRNNKVTDLFTYYNRQLQMMQLIFSFYYGQPLTSKLWWFFSAYQGQS